MDIEIEYISKAMAYGTMCLLLFAIPDMMAASIYMYISDGSKAILINCGGIKKPYKPTLDSAIQELVDITNISDTEPRYYGTLSQLKALAAEQAKDIETDKINRKLDATMTVLAKITDKLFTNNTIDAQTFYLLNRTLECRPEDD